MSELFASIDSLRAHERLGVLGLADVVHFSDVTVKMRAILIDWLFDVFKMLKLKYDTVFSAINILDAYMSRDKSMTKSDLQLIGITCLSLAAKYNEIYHPEPGDYVFISGNAITTNNLRKAEEKVFVTLGCNINVPRDMDYLRVISAVSELPVMTHNMSKNLLLTFMIEGSTYLPSVTATAVTKIISKLYNQKYVNVFDIPEAILIQNINEIVLFCRKLKKSTLLAYTKLYSPVEWGKIFDLVCEIVIIPSRDTNIILGNIKYLRSEYFKRDITINLLSRSVLPKPSQTLGEGTFGVVKKIDYLGKSYAVKKMRQFDGEITTSSFLRETSVLLSLDHPNVAKIRYITSDLRLMFFDLGVSDLRIWNSKEGPMNHDMQLTFVTQMFSSLYYIHKQGCLHRDIKPPNIIVYGSSNSPTFVLSDFGSARGPQIALRDNTFTHEVITLWYRPPEILLGQSSYNDVVDVWSMLCTIYECATGKPLFPGDSEIDQLYKIFKILGTPTDNTWTDVSSLPDYKHNFPQWKPVEGFFRNNNSLSDCYKELLIKSLVMNPGERLRSSELYKIIMKYNNKKYIANSLAGVKTIHYLYNKIDNVEIYKSKKEIGGIVSLYYGFLRSIIKTELNMLDRINSLTETIKHMDLDTNDRLILQYASENTLQPTNRLPILQNVDYYFAFRGFLFLCYIPEYSFENIIGFLNNEGASIAGIELASKLIFAQIGLNGMIKRGQVLPRLIRKSITEISSLDMFQL